MLPRQIAFLFVFALSACSSNPAIDTSQTRVGTNRYEISVKGLAILTPAETLEKNWTEQADSVCKGAAWNVVTKAFIGQQKNVLKGIVECKE